MRTALLRYPLLLLSALLGVFISFGQAGADGHSLLWEVSGKGLKKPSYLFGTIHMICPDDYVWTPAMKNALGKAEKVCLEMDMDDPQLSLEVASGMMDMTGKKLSDYFTSEQYAILSAYMRDSLGLQMELFQYMKPVALQALMTTRSASMCEDPISYEERIMDMAHEGKKEVIGLETVQEQLDALDVIPVDSLVKDVMGAVQNPNNDMSEFQQLVAAYKAQDIDALNNLIMKAEGIGSVAETLVYGRNEKWISRMEEKMKANTVFFAVGAGHLSGERGVVELLQKAGYKVVPVH